MIQIVKRTGLVPPHLNFVQLQNNTLQKHKLSNHVLGKCINGEHSGETNTGHTQIFKRKEARGRIFPQNRQLRSM